MARLVNGERIITNPRPENAGKLLIFCEGYTEYNYFYYFKNYLDHNTTRARYSDIVIEPLNTKGNAQNVYNFAENFLSKDENIRKYSLYEKHLVFDCDAPDEIQKVIHLMQQSNNHYILDYSNLLFETWLVMHFENIEPNQGVSKRAIIKRIRDQLGITKYTSKIKASTGTIGQILGSNGNEKIKAAIENAKYLDEYWSSNDFLIEKDIKIMNPSASIYKLIERILNEILYWCS